MENIENVKAFVKNLDTSITNLETSLTPLLKTSLIELTSIPNQTHQDKIKIYNNYAYVLISTIYSYLKTIGVDTDTHPIKQELTRIKNYMNRLKSLEKGELSSEKKQEIAQVKANEFLARTLGVKSVGGAVDVKTAGPAVSFQGTHTKFENETKEETKVNKTKTSNKTKTTQTKVTKKTKVDTKAKVDTKTKSNKVTKPKKNSKPKRTK
ncbi:Exosome complex protein LRP1 [Spathaspora sp. JA1]|nr:Exosome complex protein LRP1 [Spathaspora sp. JA1]